MCIMDMHTVLYSYKSQLLIAHKIDTLFVEFSVAGD